MVHATLQAPHPEESFSRGLTESWSPGPLISGKNALSLQGQGLNVPLGYCLSVVLFFGFFWYLFFFVLLLFVFN